MVKPSSPAYETMNTKLVINRAASIGMIAQITRNVILMSRPYLRVLACVVSTPIIIMYRLFAMVTFISGKADETSSEGNKMM